MLTINQLNYHIPTICHSPHPFGTHSSLQEIWIENHARQSSWQFLSCVLYFLDTRLLPHFRKLWILGSLFRNCLEVSISLASFILASAILFESSCPLWHTLNLSRRGGRENWPFSSFITKTEFNSACYIFKSNYLKGNNCNLQDNGMIKLDPL